MLSKCELVVVNIEGFIVGLLTEGQAGGQTHISGPQASALLMLWGHLLAHPGHPPSQISSDGNPHLMASVSTEMLSTGPTQRYGAAMLPPGLRSTPSPSAPF